MIEAHRKIFDVRSDISAPNELANRRQDIAQRLRPLLAEWERDVEAEAQRNVVETITSR